MSASITYKFRTVLARAGTPWCEALRICRKILHKHFPDCKSRNVLTEQTIEVHHFKVKKQLLTNIECISIFEYIDACRRAKEDGHMVWIEEDAYDILGKKLETYFALYSESLSYNEFSEKYSAPYWVPLRMPPQLMLRRAK